MSARPPALDHLVRTIFWARRPCFRVRPVYLIEAPDTGREIEPCCRSRLLLEGTPPESVAVIARDMRRYSTALRETAHAYGIPLVVREGILLRENPAVSILLDLVDLHALDFPRRELLDTLHSPYLDPPDLDPVRIARLERLSMAEQVVRGRDAWLDALRPSPLPLHDEDGELLEHPGPSDPTLRDALAHHFDRITPPESGTAYEFTRWLEALIGPDPAAAALDAAEQTDSANEKEQLRDEVPEHFNILARIRAASDSARASRDIAALQAFKRVLRGIRAAHDLLAEDGTPAVLAWADFRAELGLAVERTTVIPPGGFSRLGRVLATDVLEARGLPHDHVFSGLAETSLPQKPKIVSTRKVNASR
jgi:hypothetical protein